MKPLPDRSPGVLAAFGRQLGSVPVLIKFLGVGALIALIFGTASFVVIRSSVRATLERGIQEQSFMLAGWLASRVERKLVTDDVLGIHDTLKETWDRFPHIAYLIVEDRTGRKIGRRNELFDLPSAWMEGACRHLPGTASPAAQIGPVRVYESAAPVLGGMAGCVRVGLDDASVTDTIGTIGRHLLLALAICVFLGQGAALALTYMITRPIHTLVRATDAVERGDLDFQATGFPGDEVGALASAFNRMVAGLRQQRSVIMQREEERGQLVERLISSQEEERARVARELHDELGQALTGLMIQTRTSSDERPECAAHQKAAEAKIADMIRWVREMARSLRPSILDDFGLKSALGRHIEEVARHHACAFDFQFVTENGCDERLPPDVEVALFRVAQEAITNVVKHSGARRASVILYRRADSAMLLVEDDGRGLGSREGRNGGPGEGLGIIGMRERIEIMGGGFLADSPDGGGTTIRATIPLGG